MRRLVALLVASTLLSGCATKVEGLFVKDDFKAPQIQRGGMVAGGVIAEPGKFDLLQSNNFSNSMVAGIQSKREYIRINPSSTLINAAGKAQYTEIMNQFATGDLDQATLGKVGAKLKGTRYLALAKIDANNTEKDRVETQAQQIKNKDGSSYWQPGKITKSHKRSLIVTMVIYDLESKSVAFTGQVRKTSENSKEYEKNLASLIVSVVNAAKDKSEEETYPTPEAPQTRDVLQDVFAGFGQNLPKVD